MCCIRIETNELLANVLGSPNYDSRFKASLKNLTSVCKDLSNVLPGYVYFDLDESEMKAAAKTYPHLYRYTDGVINIDTEKPFRDSFNEIYPPNISRLIKFSIDMYLKHNSCLSND